MKVIDIEYVLTLPIVFSQFLHENLLYRCYQHGVTTFYNANCLLLNSIDIKDLIQL